MGQVKLLDTPLWIDCVQKAMRGIVVKDGSGHRCLTEPQETKWVLD